MKIFLDTANIEEVRQAASWGVLNGVTTNPSLVSNEKEGFIEIVKQISQLVDGPISAEVISLESEGMVEEGVRLAALATNVIIKIPATVEGLKAVNQLRKKNIQTNVTLIFSANQGLLAARAGAAYVSPFLGRLDDINHDGVSVVQDLVQIFDYYNLSTEIIAASIRHPRHMTEIALAGAHIATVPFNVLQQMMRHPLTDQGIEKFLADWHKSGKKLE